MRCAILGALNVLEIPQCICASTMANLGHPPDLVTSSPTKSSHVLMTLK